MAASLPIPTSRLIEDNQGLVYHLAGKIHRTLPVRYDFDDLVGYGMLGLTEAAQAFSPNLGVKFSTFAFFRIRGAIFDGIAEVSWMTRAEYRRHHQHLQEQNTGHADPLDPDRRWAAGPAEVVPLTDRQMDELVGRPAVPGAQASRQETNEQLLAAVAQLPQREQQLITMIYFEGHTLQNAAVRLGISKSWASRVHAKIIQKLGRLMDSVAGPSAASEAEPSAVE